jgi:hypothetical protein
MAQPKNEAPSWQPDAVATASGWAHPKTGEILVSQRGLLDGTEPAKEADKPGDTGAVVEAVVEEVQEVAVEEAPVTEPVTVTEEEAPAPKVTKKKAASKNSKKSVLG